MRIPLKKVAVATAISAAATLACTIAAQPAQADDTRLAVATAHSEADETAASARIPASRFPTVETVARLFPHYREGRRDFLHQRQLSLTAYTCQGVDVASTQPRAGGLAYYSDSRGQGPYFYGDTDVTVALYDFRKPKRAQAALDQERDTVSSCYGPNYDSYGYGTTFRRLAAPSLADDQFAYRQINHDVNTGDDWFISVYFRQGRFLGIARLQRDRNAPAAPAAFNLARAAVRAAS